MTGCTLSSSSSSACGGERQHGRQCHSSHYGAVMPTGLELVHRTTSSERTAEVVTIAATGDISRTRSLMSSAAATSSCEQAMLPVDIRPATCHFTSDYCLTFPVGPGDQHLGKPPSHGAIAVSYSSSQAQLMHQHPVENQYSPVTPAPGGCTTTINGELNGSSSSSNVFNFSSCLPDSEVQQSQPLQQRHRRHQHLRVDCHSSQPDAGLAAGHFPAMPIASTGYSLGWPLSQEGPAGVVDLPPERHAFFADSRAPPDSSYWYTPGNYPRHHRVFCGSSSSDDFNSASSRQQPTSAGKTPVTSVCRPPILRQTSSPVHLGAYVGQALPQSQTYPYQLDYLGQPLQKRVYPLLSSTGEPGQEPMTQPCAELRQQAGITSRPDPAESQCWGRQQQQGFGLPKTGQPHLAPAEPWPTVLLHPPTRSTVHFASDQPMVVPVPAVPRAVQRPALSLPTFQSRWGAPRLPDSPAVRADVDTEPQRTRHISAPVIRSWANYSPQTSVSPVAANRPQPISETVICRCPGSPCHLSSVGADVPMGATASVHLPWLEHALSADGDGDGGGGGAVAGEANRQASRITPVLSSSLCPGQESWTKSCASLPSGSLATSTCRSAWASEVTDLLMKSHITEPSMSAIACSSEHVFAAICSRDSPAHRVGGDWAGSGGRQPPEGDNNNKEDSLRQPLFISTPSPLGTGSQSHQHSSPSGHLYRLHRQDLASPCSSAVVADVPMAFGTTPSPIVVNELLTEERKCAAELLPSPSSAATSEAHRSLSQSMAEGTLFRNPQTVPPKTNKRKPAPIFIPPQTGANLSRLRSPRVWCPEVSPGSGNPAAALGCPVGDPPPYTPPPMLSPNRQGSGLFSSLVNSHWSPLVMRRCQHQMRSGLAGGSSCFCRRKPSGPAAVSGGANSGTGDGNDGDISALATGQQMLTGALKRSYGGKLATGAAADIDFVDDVVVRGATRPIIVARRQSTPKSAPVVLCQSYLDGTAGTVYNTVGRSINNELQINTGQQQQQQQVVEMEVDGAVVVAAVAVGDPVATDLLPSVEKEAAEPNVVFGYDDETMRRFAEADAAADRARQSRRRLRRRRCDTEVQLASFARPTLEAASFYREMGGESAAAVGVGVATEGTTVLAVLNEAAEDQEDEIILMATKADLVMQAKGDEFLECSEDEEEQDDDEDEGLPSSLIPRINVGEAFQATVPAVYNTRPAAEEYMLGERETLLWHPSNLDDRDPRNMESLNLLTKIACSPAVCSCGLNMEYTFHLLCKYKGNLEKTLHALLHDSLVVYDYVYAETTVWTTEEIVRFQCGLARYGRDFYLIAKAMQASGMKKTVKACVEFYYVWKRMNTPSDVKLYRDRSTRRRARVGDDGALIFPVFPEEPVVDPPTVYASTTLEVGGSVRQPWEEASFGSVAMAAATGAAAAPYNLRRKPPPALGSVALSHVTSSAASGQQSLVTATANDELQHTLDTVPSPPPPVMMMVDDAGFGNERSPPPPAATSGGLCLPSLLGDDDDDGDDADEGDVELELEGEAEANEGRVMAFAEPQQLPADADCFLIALPDKATGQLSAGDFSYPCRLCNRVFAKVKSRNAHMKSHSNHHRPQPQ